MRKVHQLRCYFLYTLYLWAWFLTALMRSPIAAARFVCVWVAAFVGAYGDTDTERRVGQ